MKKEELKSVIDLLEKSKIEFIEKEEPKFLIECIFLAIKNLSKEQKENNIE